MIQLLEGEDISGGRSNNDRICGGYGQDVLSGDDYFENGAWHNPDNGPGEDILNGGPQCDHVLGNGLRDYVIGGPGDDTTQQLGGCSIGPPTGRSGGLYGVHGDDSVLGEDGVDYLDGGPGTDYLSGGAGYDTCSFDGTDTGVCENWV